MSASDQNITVMLGDSLTAGNNWRQAFPGRVVVNQGINGDTWAGVWGRLNETTALNPAKIFLQIGINDFLRGARPDEITEGHLKIWAELTSRDPKAKLHVVSLLPYLEEALPGLLPNLDIIYINSRLSEEAEKAGLPFIDVFSPLADADKQLRPEYTTDGVHLTEAAYRLWEDRLRPFMAA